MQIKNICCIGAGYVGGPTMSVIALKCDEFKKLDLDLQKVFDGRRILKNTFFSI